MGRLVQMAEVSQGGDKRLVAVHEARIGAHDAPSDPDRPLVIPLQRVRIGGDGFEEAEVRIERRKLSVAVEAGERSR